MRALYAGSFDPITNGHLHLIQKASLLFKDLLVVVAHNPEKRYQFSLEKRVEMATESLEGLPIEVVAVTNRYIADFAQQHGIRFLIRGIRSNEDFSMERSLYEANRSLSPTVETLFLMPDQGLHSLSSSFVKGLVGPCGWREVVAEKVPPCVLRGLKEDYILGRLRNCVCLSGPKAEEFLKDHERPYHNIDHLIDILEITDQRISEPKRIFDLAILCHDWVQGPSSISESVAKANSLNKQFNYLLSLYIEATDHTKPCGDSFEEKLICSADLAILASEPKRYQKYVDSVRQEYNTLSDEEWRIGRSKFLESLLSRDPLFPEPELEEKLRDRALQNITLELGSLKSDRDSIID